MRRRKLIVTVGIVALIAAAAISYRLGDVTAAGLVLVGLVPGHFLAISSLLYVFLVVLFAIAFISLAVVAWRRTSGIPTAVFCCLLLASALVATIRVPRIVPLTTPLVVAIGQRHSAPVPGTGGEYLIRIGDITGGQVMFSMERRSGVVLLEPRSVREGQVVSFDLGGRPCYVRVVRFVNYLVGDDYGEFEVSSNPPKGPMLENSR